MVKGGAVVMVVREAAMVVAVAWEGVRAAAGRAAERVGAVRVVRMVEAMEAVAKVVVVTGVVPTVDSGGSWPHRRDSIGCGPASRRGWSSSGSPSAGSCART